MRLCLPLFAAVLLAASAAPALQAQTALPERAAPPTHELRASGQTLPLSRGYAPSAERVLAPDSLFYDDGSPGPDDYLGFGSPTPFYAATRFTTSDAFTLTGLRLAYNSSSGALYVWVFAADGQANEPTSGTQLFTAQGTNPAPNGAFIPVAIQPTLAFPAGASFYVVVGFPDVIYPMGTDATARPGGAGRHFFSGTGQNGSWTALGDVLPNGQPDAWVLRALGQSGGGGNAPDIAVGPGSLSLTAPAGGSASGSLSIQNTGTGPLTWSASATSSLQPDAPREGRDAGQRPHARRRAADRSGATPTAPADVLRLLRERAERQGTVRVIAELALPSPFRVDAGLSRADAEAQEAAIAAAGAAVAERLGSGAVGAVRTYASVPFVAVEVTPAGLETLAADPGVVRVHEDRLGEAHLGESTGIIGAPQAWAAGYTGAGQTVAVLDNGTLASHPFFGGRTVGEACFSTPSAQQGVSSLCPNGQPSQVGQQAARPCTFSDACNHGTHVAGISLGDGAQFKGVAPGASLVAVNVFVRIDNPQICGDAQPCIRTVTSDQMAALDWIYQNRNNAAFAAINMSLGGGQFFAPCDNEPLKPMIDQLRAAGIATVISSGNNGFVDSMGAPGCISSAVSVGSTGDGSGGQQVDAVSNFSNSASFLDLLAPGAEITSSIAVGGQYGPLSGTSMASPHVAGAWAVLKQRFPSESVDQILQRLRQTGRPIVDGGNGLTFPRIQLDAALGGGGGGWLSVSPAQGTTPPGQQSAVQVQVDAAGLSAGTYSGQVVIASNDPDQPSLTVPVQLTVQGGGGNTVLTHLGPNDQQATFTTSEGGFVHGTNGYGDQAKAVAFEAPVGSRLARVDVAFSRRAPAPQLQQYTLRVYGGTAQTGPQGGPLFEQTYAVSAMQVDADPNTPSPMTAHAVGASVSGPFFVSVEYGPSYGVEDFAIAATATGAASPYEWEKWSDGTWHTMSEAWANNADGWHMWVEAALGTGTAAEDEAGTPGEVALLPSAPNPARSTAALRFVLPAPADAELAVYDLLGRRVALLAAGPYAAGRHEAVWDAADAAPGVYVARLTTGAGSATQRVTVVR